MKTKNPSLTEYFLRGTRDDGTSFFHLSPSTPEWLTDAVYDAHDGEGPNDWRYSVCRLIVDELTGDNADEDNDVDDGDNVQRVAASVTDRETTYTSDVLNWASENLSRLGYYHDHVADYGDTGSYSPVEGLSIAMHRAIYDMTLTLADAIATAITENNPED
jgi:hypothetical protein